LRLAGGVIPAPTSGGVSDSLAFRMGLGSTIDTAVIGDPGVPDGVSIASSRGADQSGGSAILGTAEIDDALAKIAEWIRTVERIKFANPAPTVSGDVYGRIRGLLVNHLGSDEAADAWLNSRETGYPDTALAAIKSGAGELVLGDLESQWGPSPAYA